MIVRERPGLLKLFFILRGSIVQRIFPELMAVFALALLEVVLHRSYPGIVPVMNGAPFALLGIALSIFLGFRNNACYDRWWEARKLWGQLVYVVRDLARQALIIPASEACPDPRARLIRHAIAFAHLMVNHLRPGRVHGGARDFLPEGLYEQALASRNPPDFVIRHMGALLAADLRHGRISDIQYRLLDETIGRMSAVLAGCERLRNTPVPFGYTLLLHRTAYLFCFLLPLGFADTLGWATPFAAVLVAYTFFGLDALGDELEEPFGELPNDLPIAALADMIEINLREAMGETDLPAPPQPVDYILL